MVEMPANSKSKADGASSSPAPESSESKARWRRRKAARPQEILDAALSLFAEKGFAATRLEEIAARAGVSKGTIYLYFESKEAVFKALVQEKLASRIDGFAEMLRAFEGSSSELLTLILRNFGTIVSTSNFVV